MNEAELRWIAGILEGEGSFSFRTSRVAATNKRKRKLRIRLSMTDFDIVARVRNLTFPGGSIRCEQRSKQNFIDGYIRKDAFILEITGFRAAALMTAILPFMGERRSQRINEALTQFDCRLGPVYTAPTQEEREIAAIDLAALGLK